MNVTSIDHMIAVLQTAVGPVILISGVGLLLLTMTNRLARVIDRARLTARQARHEPSVAPEVLRSELAVLWSRARRLRVAIALTGLSALLAAVLVIALFLVSWLQLDSGWLIGAIFVGCMVSLILGLSVFLLDVNAALDALGIEIDVDPGP